MVSIIITRLLFICGISFQPAVEPMQVDAIPEENDNIDEINYVVENTTLVM